MCVCACVCWGCVQGAMLCTFPSPLALLSHPCPSPWSERALKQHHWSWELETADDTHRDVLLGWKWHFKGNVCVLEIRVVQRIQVPFFNGLRKEKWWSTRQPLLGVESIIYIVRMPLLMPFFNSAGVTGPSWDVAFMVILCSVRGCVPLKH